MTAAPKHAPKMAELSLAQRLAPWMPVLLVPALVLLGALAIPETSSWLTLTVSGLAMGMMIFIMASGLTLVFGLMDVINFGHGAFVSIGAFVGVSVLLMLGQMTAAPSLGLNLIALMLAVVGAMAATGLVGWAFEKVIVMPVYGHHLKQILVTMGGLIVVEQLIVVLWGPEEIYIARPEALKGAITFAGAALEKYRLVAVVVGLIVFAVMRFVLRRTKIGLIVRAGVQNGEMVQALGYRLRLVFVGVFIAGSALAGLGGVMWGLYQEVITAQMGNQAMILIFIVVIIGGLGSVEGCFIGALLVGLLQNYVAFLEPKAALISNIALMMPGVDSLLVVRNSIRGGWRDGIFTSTGICCGLFIHATLSALGISVLLLHSATAYSALKLAGGGYLIWLGGVNLRHAMADGAAADLGPCPSPAGRHSWRRSFREGLICNVFNPKTLLFYMAFLPQFINPQRSALVQSLAMAAVHFAIAMIYQGVLAGAATRMKRLFKRTCWRRIGESVVGVLLMSFGMAVFLERR